MGGGRTFAAKPRSYEQKVNRKAYRVAIRSIFSELVRQGRLKVVEIVRRRHAEDLAMVAKLAELEVPVASLLVTENAAEYAVSGRAQRSVYSCLDVAGLDPVSLVGADHVLMTVESVKKIEEWLA